MSRKSLICLFIITIASIHAAPSKFSKTHLSHERIVGGYELNITEVPWQASLQMEGVRHFCGGSIIGQQWILTAAHCVTEYEEDSTPLRVLVGITHKEKNVPSLKTAKVFVHPSYDEESTDYDFALIRLTEKINYNEKVNSIKLPDINDTDLAAGTLCLISGWGNTQNPNESPVRLRGAKVPLVEHDLCNEAYDGIVTPRMICAGDYEHGGKDGKRIYLLSG